MHSINIRLVLYACMQHAKKVYQNKTIVTLISASHFTSGFKDIELYLKIHLRVMPGLVVYGISISKFLVFSCCLLPYHFKQSEPMN